MCEHKNLKSINDMLICKDCGQQLPLSFLKDRGKKKGKDADPAPVVQPETPPEAVVEQETALKQVNSDEKPTENAPVESQTNKSTSEKKPRKNAKKGA